MKPVVTELSFSRKRILPMIFQDELAECGHACVAMISSFWGQPMDLSSLRKLTKPSTHGVTLRQLMATFETTGFRARALRVSLDGLSSLKTPAVLHWNMNHFVVLKQVKKNYIIIHDPATGVRRCSFAEASCSFTGVVLAIERTEDFEPIRLKKSLCLSDLIKTIHGTKRFIALLLLLSLCIELFSLINPLFMQYVTDDVLGLSSTRNLYVLATAFLMMVLLHGFSEYIRGNMVVYLTNQLTERFASNVFSHLLKLPLSFFEARHKGDIQSKFQSIDVIQKKISTDFINTVLDGLMIILNLMVMLIYSPLLAMLVLLSLSIFMAMRYASYHSLKQYTSESIHQHAKSSSLFLETLYGILPIKSFLKEQSRFNVWRQSYIRSLNADIRVSKIQVLYHVANQVLFQVEHIGVICLGAQLVLSKRFSVGMLMAFLSYRLLLVGKASSFIQQVFDYKLISIQLNRLSDLVLQAPEVIDSGVGLRDKSIQGGLTLKNVFFQYHPDERFIFSNLNITIQAGEKVAIIGPSGCGKSTLLKVMMGLLKQASGEIYLDEHPLDTFGLKNYRALSASVMQDDVLFSGSILDNIVFFDEEIDVDAAHQVAKLACIHETIMKLPMGYETRVGDMGSILSGGQKQRILLARALYKRPKILFLDEATSHLDADNEQNINHSLKALNMTQIIVAHRHETIAMADRVIDLGKP